MRHQVCAPRPLPTWTRRADRASSRPCRACCATHSLFDQSARIARLISATHSGDDDRAGWKSDEQGAQRQPKLNVYRIYSTCTSSSALAARRERFAYIPPGQTKYGSQCTALVRLAKAPTTRRRSTRNGTALCVCDLMHCPCRGVETDQKRTRRCGIDGR